MIENIKKIITWYELKFDIILSLAGTFYLIFSLLSMCLLFKDTSLFINQSIALGLDFARNIVFLVFLISIIFQIYIKKLNWLLIFIFGILTTFVFFFSKSLEPIKAFLAIIALSNLSFKTIFQKYYRVFISFLVIVILLCAFGMVDNILYDSQRFRFGVGFDWVTTAPILLFHILLFKDCFVKKKWSNDNIVLSVLCITLLFLLTKSRFVFLLSLLFIGSILMKDKFGYWKSTELLEKFLKYLLWTPIFLTIFSVLIFLLYNPENQIWNSINNLMSNRLELGNQGLIKYGWTLFGQKIQWIGYGFQSIRGIYNYIDNSYVRFLLEYGIINTIFYLFILTFGMKESLKKENFQIMMPFIFLNILGFIEHYFYNHVLNPFLIYCFKELNLFVQRKRLGMRK